MAKSRIAKHIAFLKYVASASPQERKKILEGATREQLTALCEVTLNVAKKNIQVPTCVKDKLCKHHKVIRLISDRKSSLIKKKRALIQKGGFLPVLLRTALPFLIERLLR